MIFDHRHVRFTPYTDHVLRAIRPTHTPITSLLSFDLETFLIQSGQTAPKMVCMSAMIRAAHAGYEPTLYHAQFDRDALAQLFHQALIDRRSLLLGAYVSFDLCVLANEFPEFLPLIFDALDQDRVVCVELAQRLIDTATNQLGGYYLPDGTYVKHGYSLAALAKRHLGIEMDKDTWRLRYGTLWNTPVDQWEPGAVDYSVGDSVVAGACLQAMIDPQSLGASDPSMRVFMSTPERVGPELTLIDLFRQTRAQFWLALMVARGIRVDPAAVARLRTAVERELATVLPRLKEAGLVRPNGERDTQAAAARMTAVMMLYGKRPKTTPKGGVALDEDACIESGDALLADYASYTSLVSIMSKDVEVLEEPAARGLPIQSRFETLLETGRTSCSGGARKKTSTTYSYQLQNPRRKLGLFHAAIESLKRRAHEELDLQVDLRALERQDEEAEATLGVRQCFVPRPGFVFSSNDFSMFELCSWSQVSADLGIPLVRLIDALQSRRDVHLELGARVVGVSYDDALARKKEPQIKEARQMAKCFHPDTEVLTRTGWVRICDLIPGQEVMTASVRDGYAVPMQWEVPERLTHREFSGNLVHLKNMGIDLRVTPDHRMAAWAQGKHARAIQVSPHAFGSVRYWPSAGWYEGGTHVENEWLLRLAVATQADGTLSRRQIRFGFVKNRKKDRLRWLMSQAGIEWTERDRTNYPGCVDFSLHDQPQVAEVKRLLDPDKTFPWWWLNLAPWLVDAVLDEVFYWDGTRSGRQTQYQFCSYIDKNLDVLQALASVRGRKTRQGETHKLSVKLKAKSRGENLSIEDVPYVGNVYCLTVKSDAVLVRDGGVPVITHQCANFGYPGGLGWRTFREFARSNYGVIVDDETSQMLKRRWLDTWEPQAYFDFIARLVGPADMGEVIHVRSHRRRAWVPYTVAANSFFQGLAADCAKAAGYEIAREMYLGIDRQGRRSPLEGSRIVNFVHDEFISEHPLDLAHEAAHRVAEIMSQTSKLWMPDCPPWVEPALMESWQKGAEAVYENGRLVPWRPKA